MDQLLSASNPVLLFAAVILSFLSAFTAVDLLNTLRTTEGNKKFLFYGSSFSMGISIWTMNFFGILALDETGVITYNSSVTILSVVLGVALSAMGFMAVSGKTITLRNVLYCSLLMTMSVLSNYIIGMYALNHSLNYNPGWLLVTTLFIFILFTASFMLLFYAAHRKKGSQLWLKPVSTMIITFANAAGHLFLKQAMPVETNIENVNQLVNDTQFVLYLVFFVTIIVLSGLIGSSTLKNKVLARSDRYLTDIRYALDQSSIVAITDHKGTITYANDKFAEISKYSQSELIGKNHSLLNSGFHSKGFFKDLWDTIQSGETWKGEICNRAKDGSLYWVNTTIVPFMRRGRPYQYIAIRTDITRQKEGEKELLDLFREVRDIHYALDESAIVVFTDPDGVITKVNQRFCDITKYERQELIGKKHAMVNSGYHSAQFFEDMWKQITSGHVWRGEVRNKAKDGSHYWVDATIVPFMDAAGEVEQFISIRYDITERKETEERLHRQDKLAAIGQLAAGVAHEIRNPLTSMKGYAEFLEMEETDEDRREYLAIILDEIDRVDHIVEEFLMLAKPQTVHLKRENMIPLMEEVISLFELEGRKQNISFTLKANPPELYANCDKNRLKQVLVNFVKNAMEAMPDGGLIELEAGMADGEIKLSIRDQGSGITEEKLKKLGQPFFTTKKNGNGLGLMVSFKIIESHHGRVLADSVPGKGTVFSILLPAEK